MANALDVNNLVVDYGDTRAVDGLSLSVRPGTVQAIVGPNGAGKTTSVETCEGYRRPTSGNVRLFGLDPIRDAHVLRPRVGVMLQSGGVPSGAKARDALTHLARFYESPQDPDQLIDLLGLGNVRSTFRRMSGGEQQRLKFAIALIGRPELVFLDEPTAGLDAHGKRVVWDVIEALRSVGVTVVLTTHSMEEVERLADRVAVVNSGRVIAEGSPAELTTSTTPLVDFRTATSFDEARLQAALPPASAALLRGECEYRVTGANAAELLAAVTGWCANNSVEIVTISTGHRRLEDVFIELTSEAEQL
ncbi:MAG: ABC transporter ATP-binding protein [Actinobacteria bacterium]|nr:ABC transporter ATP-binding protein [Actinomycetota bacterium]